MIKATYESMKRKLEVVVKVFRNPENTEIIDKMIAETLEKIGLNLILEATIKELRSQFKIKLNEVMNEIRAKEKYLNNLLRKYKRIIGE